MWVGEFMYRAIIFTFFVASTIAVLATLINLPSPVRRNATTLTPNEPNYPETYAPDQLHYANNFIMERQAHQWTLQVMTTSRSIL